LLKIVFLEVGAGWVPYWLDRMDAVYDSVMGRGVPLKEKPSFYFRRNVWVSADPDEKSLPAMVELCGSDRFFWRPIFRIRTTPETISRSWRSSGTS
jgi:hypothetical protein